MVLRSCVLRSFAPSTSQACHHHVVRDHRKNSSEKFNGSDSESERFILFGHKQTSTANRPRRLERLATSSICKVVSRSYLSCHLHGRRFQKSVYSIHKEPIHEGSSRNVCGCVLWPEHRRVRHHCSNAYTQAHRYHR